MLKTIMNKQRIFKVTALVFLLLLIVIGFYAYREYNRKNNSLTDIQPNFTTTATVLINEFTTNEKQSNTTYSGKVIQLSGTIKSIDKDDKGYFTIALGDASSMSSVRCSIDSTETTRAATLQTNALVNIKGICTGFNADEMGLGSDVILNRCVIIKP
jgi:hypothetical protein